MLGGNTSAQPVGRKLARALAGLIAVGIVATGCTASPKPATDQGSSQATVVRIIDGDTLVADISGTEETVRLLNIDTPETKDPQEPVQCLGPEATQYLESLLAPGDKVDLEFDVERLDQYGRTLAGVYKDGSLVNADIAAAGLGVAVLYPPNERFYAEVKAAEATAAKKEEGLFSPAIDCTVPATAAGAIEALDALEQTDPSSSAAAGNALTVVTAAVVAGKAKSAALKALNTAENGTQGAVWATIKGKYLPKLNAAMTAAQTVETRLTTAQTDLAKVEKAKQEAKAKAKQKAAAKKKAVARQKVIAAENLAASKRKAAAAAAKRYVAPKKTYAAPKKTYRAPVQKPKPKTGGGSYAGYTGPRCYAPGGQSWKPC